MFDLILEDIKKRILEKMPDAECIDIEPKSANGDIYILFDVGSVNRNRIFLNARKSKFWDDLILDINDPGFYSILDRHLNKIKVLSNYKNFLSRNNGTCALEGVKEYLISEPLESIDFEDYP